MATCLPPEFVTVGVIDEHLQDEIEADLCEFFPNTLPRTVSVIHSDSRLGLSIEDREHVDSDEDDFESDEDEPHILQSPLVESRIRDYLNNHSDAADDENDNSDDSTILVAKVTLTGVRRRIMISCMKLT
jgi:hypothetical protein